MTRESIHIDAKRSAIERSHRADMIFSQTDEYSDTKDDWMNKANELGVFITWSHNNTTRDNTNVYLSTYNLSKVNQVYEEPFFQKYITHPYSTENVNLNLFITESSTRPEFLLSPKHVYII